MIHLSKKRARKNRAKAYSLLEMLIVLVLTSMILLALITLVAEILRISAVTNTRTKMREDMTSFTLEFEKDLRNADTVTNCNGFNDSFQCDFSTTADFRWTSCARVTPPLCDSLGNNCDLKGAELTMCKYILDSSGNPDGPPLVKFDDIYNFEQFGVTSVTVGGGGSGTSGNGTGDPLADDTRTAVSFTAVISHPNQRLNINNMVRQSLISTKNF